MRLLRRQRRWLSGCLILLLLFMQGATAAYACPMLGQTPAAAAAPAAMAVMPGCGGDMQAMDPAQPQLCRAHCEAGQQSVNAAAGVLDAPAAMAHGLALVAVLPLAEAAELASAMPSATAAGPPVGTPPLYLRLLVLRN